MATVQTTVTTQTVHTQQHLPRRQYGVRACLLMASLALACQAFLNVFIGWRAHTVVTSSGGRPTGLAPDMTVPNILFIFGINLAIQAVYLAYTAIRPRDIRSKGKQGIAIVAILAYPVADIVKYTLFHHILHTGVPYNTFLDGPVPLTSGLVFTIAGSLYLWYVLLRPQKSERQ